MQVNSNYDMIFSDTFATACSSFNSIKEVKRSEKEIRTVQPYLLQVIQRRYLTIMELSLCVCVSKTKSTVIFTSHCVRLGHRTIISSK